MTWFDMVIILLVVISALIGLARGFVKEFVALTTWVAAIWLAVTFSADVAFLLPQWLESARFSLGVRELEIHNLRVGIAFLLLVVGTLLVGSILNYLIGKMVKAPLLKGADRLLGLIFGVARGAAIVVILVMAAGLTRAPQALWWRDSALIAPFESAAIGLIDLLPRPYAQHFSFARRSQ
jgi:membrane protein required for colicin V production